MPTTQFADILLAEIDRLGIPLPTPVARAGFAGVDRVARQLVTDAGEEHVTEGDYRRAVRQALKQLQSDDAALTPPVSGVASGDRAHLVRSGVASGDRAHLVRASGQAIHDQAVELLLARGVLIDRAGFGVGTVPRGWRVVGRCGRGRRALPGGCPGA